MRELNQIPYTGEIYPPINFKLAALLFYSALSEEEKRVITQFLKYNGQELEACTLKERGAAE
ncbi:MULTISPECIES: hypothetical protein [Bacillus]|uniref:hypothetical protein n=1 Tax=Bacillus TaxID=1386 RepID=UPI0006AD8F5D|nr:MULTISPECIES: hypothetical protein [Bacillus]MBL3614933.1 hypothetical protein [Bacillus sp. RHFS18]AWD86541.1 hypothetical protein BVQ_03275 [Bacillus velezensis]KAF6688570.1 hypothetical protein G9362_20465 [Bacillus sp. EKM601B]KOS49100.1 hypothetical protein AN272_20305 [Bacillus amyloliquefaciens]MBA9150624.1 hypothetical protein [Bacillus sp. EKM213B]